MNLLSTLAARNLLRNKRRTLLSISAIAFSVMILVFAVGLQESSYSLAIDANTSILTGHFQIQAEDYLENREFDNTFKTDKSLIDRLSTTLGVSALTKRSSTFVIAATDERSVGIEVMGVEPDTEQSVSKLTNNIISGTYLDNGASFPVILGKGLSKKLKVDLGGEITLLGQTKDRSVAAGVFEVVGIFDSGIAELDRQVAQITLADFDNTFEMNSSAHLIAGRVSNLSDLAPTLKRVNELIDSDKLLSNLVVHSWSKLLPGLRESINLDQASSWLFFSSLVLIVAFLVLNTFLMAVLERTKEFGVMLSIGSKNKLLVKMVLLEAVFLTIVGIAVGILAGCAVLAYLGQVGFYVPGSEEISKMWNLPTRIYTEISAKSLTLGPTVVTISCLLSALPPAIYVLKLRPLDALRSQTGM